MLKAAKVLLAKWVELGYLDRILMRLFVICMRRRAEAGAQGEGKRTNGVGYLLKYHVVRIICGMGNMKNME